MKSPLLFTQLTKMPLLWKVWVLLLFSINLSGGIAFIDNAAGKSAIVSLVGAAIVMAVIYARHGFVRLLGLGRILFWLPMEIEFSLNLIKGNPQGLFFAWLLTLLIINGICICMDFIDVIRFALGDSKPVTPLATETEQENNATKAT